jgi:hypothetical protein
VDPDEDDKITIEGILVTTGAALSWNAAYKVGPNTVDSGITRIDANMTMTAQLSVEGVLKDVDSKSVELKPAEQRE